MALPTFFAKGTFTAGISTIAPPFPLSTLANDIALLLVETSNQLCTLSVAQGFVEVINGTQGSPQGTGTAATLGSTRLTLFWKRLVGGDTAPTVADSGDHQIGQHFVFRGCQTSGNPWNITAGGVEATSDTSGVIPGATTTVADCLVVVMVSMSFDVSSNGTELSGWTNADLTSLTERADQTNNSGLGGGFGLADGGKAAAGAYGTTSVTHVTATKKALLTVALAPPPVGTAVGQQPVVVRQAVMRSAVR